MNLEEFKVILEDIGVLYTENKNGNSIVVTDYKKSPAGALLLNSIEEIPAGVEFAYRGTIYMWGLKRISPSVKFSDLSVIHSPLFPSVWETGIGMKFVFSVPGISDNRVLNRMISLGLFDRKEIR
jgi:hypothetical protein